MFTSIYRLIRFLVRAGRGIPRLRSLVTLVFLSGTFAGAASVGLLGGINELLARRGGQNSSLAIWFGAACAVLLLSRFASQYLLAALSGQAIMELRLGLARRVLEAPLSRLEEEGNARILSVLTEDVAAVSGALAQLPLLLMHTVVVFGCLSYLLWLSVSGFFLVVVVVAVGVLTYQIPMARALRHLRVAREWWDSVYHGFGALLGGIKELKLHAGRQRAFLGDELGNAVRAQYQAQLRGTTIYAAATSWGQLLFFVTIGALLFGAGPVAEADDKALTGFVLVLLYLMTPLEAILQIVPILGRAEVSSRRIDELGWNIEVWGREQALDSVEPMDPAWKMLRLEGVEKEYLGGEGDRPFHLGPITLDIPRGELIFLVGGNGSGKTTLAKLLVGLYEPSAGRILLDGRQVGADDRPAYRQLFCTVFFDFYLFSNFLGLVSEDLQGRAQTYLEELDLAHKVSVTEKGISNTNLSQGQRKRLALLTAYLEDRAIYLFDEWAADQDPEFKEVFYWKILPELITRGKTVLVISHDSRYFDRADRIIYMEAGGIVSQKIPREAAPVPFAVD